jgi:hypothetical protein
MTTSSEDSKHKELLQSWGVECENDAEYEEAWRNLVGYFDLLIQIDHEQKRTLESASPDQV